jgi:CheY-like chemotaxis protein
MNRKIILKMLGKKDIVCDVAVDGLEALESVKRKKYDVILRLLGKNGVCFRNGHINWY